MNRERVLTDAKERALELLRAGYEPPQPRTDIPAPGENILAALKMGVHLMRQGDYITRIRSKAGNQDRGSALRRERLAGHSGKRAVPARSGARRLQVSVRREEDAGADPVHAEDGEDVEELRAGWQSTINSTLSRASSTVTHNAMKVRDAIRRLENDGWRLVRTKGSHRQFHHPSKPGTVTIAGHRHWTFRQEH